MIIMQVTNKVFIVFFTKGNLVYGGEIYFIQLRYPQTLKLLYRFLTHFYI